MSAPRQFLRETVSQALIGRALVAQRSRELFLKIFLEFQK
jgi:hypothetical protein